MNLSDLRIYTYRDLAEANIGNDRVTQVDVDAALNQAYERIASETGCFVREETTATAAGSGKYDLPEDMYAIRGLLFTEPENGTTSATTTPLTPTTTKNLSFLCPGWRNAASGTPTHYYFYDSRKIGIYPPPPVGKSLTIEGYVIPIDAVLSENDDRVAILKLDSDSPQFPANFHMLLVHAAVYTLCTRYLLDGDAAVAKATAAKNDYEELMKQFRSFYANGVTLAAGRE